jgi:DnaJ-class molecular chaperone
VIRVGETSAPCPVCDGRGQSLKVIKWGREIRSDGSWGKSIEVVTPSTPCRACAGTGRILQAVDSRDEQP